MSGNLIYGLFDMHGNVRYVGMSTSGLIRPNKHLMPSSYNSKSKKSYHVYNWIRKSIKNGFIPLIKVLEFCEKKSLYKKEQKWIRYFKKKNIKLTNKTDGGPGMLGLKHSLESKKKMSKALKGKQPCSQILEMFKKQKGKNHPMYGRKHSKETLEKLIISHLGYQMPEEQKNKISQALKGKKRGPISESHRVKLSEAKNNVIKPIICIETGVKFRTSRMAAETLQIHRRALMNYLNGKRRTPIKGFTFKYFNEGQNV